MVLVLLPHVKVVEGCSLVSLPPKWNRVSAMTSSAGLAETGISVALKLEVGEKNLSVHAAEASKRQGSPSDTPQPLVFSRSSQDVSPPYHSKSLSRSIKSAEIDSKN